MPTPRFEHGWQSNTLPLDHGGTQGIPSDVIYSNYSKRCYIGTHTITSLVCSMIDDIRVAVYDTDQVYTCTPFKYGYSGDG